MFEGSLIRHPRVWGPVRCAAAVAAGLASAVVAVPGAAAASGGGGPALAPPALNLTLVAVDNSHADSWLEVDRTANPLVGGGEAGSDHND